MRTLTIPSFTVDLHDVEFPDHAEVGTITDFTYDSVAFYASEPGPAVHMTLWGETSAAARHVVIVRIDGDIAARDAMTTKLTPLDARQREVCAAILDAADEIYGAARYEFLLTASDVLRTWFAAPTGSIPDGVREMVLAVVTDHGPITAHAIGGHMPEVATATGGWALVESAVVGLVRDNQLRIDHPGSSLGGALYALAEQGADQPTAN